MIQIEELKQQKSNYESKDVEIHMLKSQINENMKLLAQNGDLIQDLTASNLKLNEQVEGFQKLKMDMDKGYEKMREERNALKNKFNEALKDKEKANKNLDEAADVILALKAKQVNADEKLEKANLMLMKSEQLLQQVNNKN